MLEWALVSIVHTSVSTLNSTHTNLSTLSSTHGRVGTLHSTHISVGTLRNTHTSGVRVSSPPISVKALNITQH